MKIYTTILTLSAMALLAACSLEEKSEDSSDQFAAAEKQSEVAVAELSKDFPGISAAVFMGADKVWSSTHGISNLSDETPVSEETRFNIYSTSKALTGLAFARLEQENRVDIDQTVGQLAPDLADHFHPIRIRDILSHTSGIRHYNSPMDWLGYAQLQCDTPADAIAYFAEDPLVHEPGQRSTYSTFAFVVASELLLRITVEKDFSDALNNALGPWANFELDHRDAAKATMYIQAGRLPQPPEDSAPDDIVAMPPLSAECKFGGGGIIASSTQLARAGAALYRGEIIPSDKLVESLLPWSDTTKTVYGAAVGKHETLESVYHSFSLSGGAPGGRSFLLVLIEPQIAVAIAGNVEGPNMSEAAWAIAKAWLELEQTSDR